VNGKNFYQISSILLGNINVSDFTAFGTDELKIIVPATAVTGELKIVAASGIATAQLVVEIPVGVEEHELSPKIEIYPNPVEGILRIVYKDDLVRETTIRMMDSRGVSVTGLHMKYLRDGWEVDMHALPVGLYVFLFNRGAEPSRIFKVVKK
jgi:hypothetical protein